MNLVTCLLPDGSIAGPVPLFAGAPEMIEDVTSTTAEERNEIAAPVALAVLVLVGLGGVLFVRRRKTV
jgi:LPXTG-motif cell wall-anchored protein